MRRHGGLWPQITSMENLTSAYKAAAKYKSSKANVQKFRLDVDGNLENIREMLVNKTYKTSRYNEKIVYEPKKRTIYVLPFNPDRVIHHALIDVLAPIWEGLFIADSYACRVGKGIREGSKRTMEFVRRNKYCLKCDISKFYPSMDHDVLLSIIKRKIKCKDTLWLTEEIIRSFPGDKNIPIGNYTSQWFGNLYLNELDHFVKSSLHIKDYLRYCDDFCLFNNNKSVLKDCAKRIEGFINEKLLLKFSRCDLFPVTQGVDFLGYRHFKDYILLRKSTTKRVKKRLTRLPKLYAVNKITAEQYRSSVASTWGWLKHANTHNLAVSLQFNNLFKEVNNL